MIKILFLLLHLILIKSYKKLPFTHLFMSSIFIIHLLCVSHCPRWRGFYSYSITKLCPTLWDTMGCMQLARLLCPSLSLGVCSNSCPLSWWCSLTISSSATPFSFFLQSFPASGSFPISQLFASGGQSTGASASASVLPKNIQQGWFPLALTCFISLQSSGLSRVFSRTIVWTHQFFCAQPSFWSSSHNHTWLLEKP